MQEDSNYCLQFYTVCRFIGLVFLSFLRRLSRLLNRNLIDFCGLGKVKVLLRLKCLRMLYVFLRRKEDWDLKDWMC
jgi:hypothetical protein